MKEQGTLLQIDLGAEGAYIGRLTQATDSARTRITVTGFRRLSEPRFEGAAAAPSWRKPGDSIERPSGEFQPSTDEGYSYPDILRLALRDYDARLEVDPKDTSAWIAAEMIKQQLKNHEATERYSLDASAVKPVARRRSRRR